jgi:hypothetical protein
MLAGSQPPPKISAKSPLPLFAGVVLAVTILGVGAVEFFFNPYHRGFYPVCLFHKLTGLNCPGCGMTRALHALLRGQFLRALHDNALFVFTLAALALRGLWFEARRFFHKPAGSFFEPEFLWAFLAVAIVFGVLRNLAEFYFLSP